MRRYLLVKNGNSLTDAEKERLIQEYKSQNHDSTRNRVAKDLALPGALFGNYAGRWVSERFAKDGEDDAEAYRRAQKYAVLGTLLGGLGAYGGTRLLFDLVR